ncbi:NADPH-dependent ferric siderophore reductase [Isoptericola jiangsuensis]|uniref:NADPH-dependent ferric siderophore reductase n=1 Tax=Isoptericola jiangsuensis TaxID=548579 RepID=A0A2A9EZI7_9MICO|nr:siderophore-interacting protein [Isoptericola jiangsuensis]PFG43680.1 NADPH-dependent ferric siderophore reductase [Isoptericola jiangsuensis]
MSGYNGRKPVEPHVLLAEVVRTKQVSEHMMRVTFGGDGLERLTTVGYDQWFRLFLQREGADAMRLPTRTSGLGWYAQYLTTPRARRPWVRSYTVREARPDLREIDVDFVLHGAHGHEGSGEPGPASTFAATARTGDTVGILDQGVGFNPRHPHDWTLLVADESGLPAVAGICEALPDDARGIAVVEVPTAADRQDFRAPAGVDVRWVERHRVDPAAVPGTAALNVVRSLDLLDGDVYAFSVGESSLATGVRRHLVADRGVPRTHADFVGYWRHGRGAAG